jgi:hypothetical protein
MISYNLREGKMTEYQNFIRSSEFRQMCEDVEKKSGFKFIDTYFEVLPSAHGEGDFDAYDMWSFPNMAAFDRAREVNAFGTMVERTWNMVEPRPTKMTLLRTASDVMIVYEPKV